MIRLRSKTTMAALMLAAAVSCGRGDASVTTVHTAAATPSTPAAAAPVVPAADTTPVPLSELAPPELRDVATSTAAPPPAALQALAAIPAPEPQVESPAEAPKAPRVTAAAVPPPAVTAPPTTAAPPPPASSSSPGAAGDFAARINGTRTARGLAALVRDGTLDSLAAGWAAHMAQTATLSHSSLPSQILTRGFTVAGENVGTGPSVQVVYDALLASPSHLANVVGASYTRVGVGVAVDANGRLWVVQLFGG